ncbi:demethylmenaquinone methyltransferase [Planctomycetota bacterium]|nr:demethylmenaquinone methyltransferase [Planctomycetota bacterium]
MATAVQAMFGRISGRYDLLNRVLSARQDVAWRRQAVSRLRPHGRVLDLACGTFDLGLEALAQGRAGVVHGCDFCLPMLHAGAAKRSGRPITASVGDALHLPFADASFDAALVAYGWRNFPDPAAAAVELHRVVRPGGQVLILEFFKPERWWPRIFHGTFGRYVIPTVGGLLSGDRSAYTYLNASTAKFLSVAEADTVLRASGFTATVWMPFFGGVSHGVIAERGGVIAGPGGGGGA